MNHVRMLSLLIASVLLVVVARGVAQTPAPAAKSAAWKIQNAMSAAPPTVSKSATILNWPAREGDPPTVMRRGTNEWTCFPDDPSTPGNDPMCVDKIWRGVPVEITLEPVEPTRGEDVGHVSRAVRPATTAEHLRHHRSRIAKA